MTADRARDRLVKILQHAHAGERGAERAYAGHAASVRDETERAEIRRIRDEELDHRERVGRALAALDSAPSPTLETIMNLIGTSIGLFCRVGGWFAPMYGAAWLESRNIGEYETAARFARDAGRLEFVDDLLDMAEVEWDHERYFREKAASHWLWRVFPKWDCPPPRSSIRARFDAGDP